MIEPAAGILLIADPFLKDPNFLRTVVLLCEHKDEGSFGFVLNKQIEQTLDELISDLEGYRLPVYYGGPVQMDTIHFLHQYPDLIPESVKVSDDIFWGGNFETVTALLKSKSIDLNKIKFFVGYSGWDKDQLEDEIAKGSWFVKDADPSIILSSTTNNMWATELARERKTYKIFGEIANDPSMN